MTFVETILATLIVSALGALTFLAYKHPKAYMRIYMVIAATILLVTIIFGTWNLSNFAARLVIETVIKDSEAAQIAASALSLPDWIMFVTLACNAYSILLLVLPWLLSDGPENEKK